MISESDSCNKIDLTYWGQFLRTNLRNLEHVSTEFKENSNTENTENVHLNRRRGMDVYSN